MSYRLSLWGITLLAGLLMILFTILLGWGGFTLCWFAIGFSALVLALILGDKPEKKSLGLFLLYFSLVLSGPVGLLVVAYFVFDPDVLPARR